MKNTLLALLAASLCLMAGGLTGCVSMGKDYNEANITNIQQGVTTEADLVAWFGNPSSRMTMSNGTVMLMWSHYTARGLAGHTTGKTLTVTMGADGKVASFSSSGGEM